jgi:tRNA pseudouridine55 synthase
VTGVLLVDKPAGPTSFDVVAQIRRALPGRPKVGHAGTLDPFATGLLVVCHGRATRLMPYLSGLDKEYAAEFQLGVRSDTGDPEGILNTSGVPLPTPDVLAAACGAFVGLLDQVPPAASAVKLGGRRAYALARAGQAPELAPRPVEVHRLALTAYDAASGCAELEIACSKGTYVRALARDLGEALGCGAHCAALRRTAIGALRVEQAGDPAAVAADPDGPFSLSPAQALAHLPARELAHGELRDAVHGRALPLHGEAGPVRCLYAGELVCVAEPQGEVLRPRVVLAEAA